MLKNKKKKTYIYILSGVALVSLISVGFSTWIIDKIQGAEVGSISVSIGKIDDSSLRIELSDVEGENDLKPIRFDSLKAGQCLEGGVITNGDGEVEKMSFKFTYTLTSGSGFSTENKIKVDYRFGGQAEEYISVLGGDAGFIDTTCIEGYSITGIDGTTDSISDVLGKDKELVAVNSTITYDLDTNSAKITSTFNFGWGSRFKNKNPCLASDSSIMDELKAFETAYNERISGDKSINVTITPAFEETTN